MKTVNVQYTTTKEFSPINQANIAGVVRELKELNHPGIKYSCWLLPDGKTFIHFDQFENEEAHQVLTSLESFKNLMPGCRKVSRRQRPNLPCLF